MRIHRALLILLGIAGLLCAWMRAKADAESRRASFDAGSDHFFEGLGLVGSRAPHRSSRSSAEDADQGAARLRVRLCRALDAEHGSGVGLGGAVEGSGSLEDVDSFFEFQPLVAMCVGLVVEERGTTRHGVSLPS